jgi:Lysozyme like domain
MWVPLVILLLVLAEQTRARAKQKALVSGASRLTLAGLRQLASSVGFPDSSLDIAAAVAMAESAGKPDAVGDVTLGRSIGLWQVNLPAHPEYSEAELYDPTVNARAAYAISRGGTWWHPWSTYTTSDPKISYKRFMPATPTKFLASKPSVWILLAAGTALGAMAWASGESDRAARQAARASRAKTGRRPQRAAA